jgi:hypothetical protein
MAVDPNKAAWVQRTLGVAVAGDQGETAPGTGGQPDPVETISPVRLAKCRLVWVQTVNNIHKQVDALKTSVMTALRASNEYDEDELDEVEDAVQELDDMVSGIDMSLIDLVDSVISADPGPPRVKAQQAAIAKADEYVKYVNDSADFALVDQNEYMPTNIKALTLSSLGVIRKELTGV